MNKFKPLNAEEKYLMDAIDDGQTRTVSKDKEQMVLNALNHSKSKAISIRINTDDLDSIKEKAAHAGLPYQTLINSIIHRYVSGQLVFEERL